jgi:hypothetical protein
MQTLTQFFNPILSEGIENTQYEVVENEVLKNSDLKNLTVSGSLFSLTTFINVTFTSCVFFGSRIENCHFINCKFENCTFQFTNLSHCKFSSTDFIDTAWDYSPIRKSTYDFCHLDAKTHYFIVKNDNILESCGLWDELHGQHHAVRDDHLSLPPTPEEEEGHHESLWMSLFNRLAA